MGEEAVALGVKCITDGEHGRKNVVQMSPSLPTNSQAAGEGSNKPNQTAIVGGVTGGAVALLLFTILALLARRRLRRRVPSKGRSSSSSFGNFIIIRAQTREKTEDFTSVDLSTQPFSACETGMLSSLRAWRACLTTT